MMTQPKQDLYGPQSRDEDAQQTLEQDPKRQGDEAPAKPPEEDAGRDVSVLLHLGLM
ncbi:MAG: hypothetical protein ACE37F_00450 [Nannocystaceae bacterium]|nr:hypothetical protein [bacterium]